MRYITILFILTAALCSAAVVTMRESADCEEASLATAAGVSYEQAKRAIGKPPFLPESVNDPLFGNPENMKAAIRRLNRTPITRTQTDILTGNAAAGKTVVLLRASTLQQHWVCLESVTPTHVSFHWGDGTIKRFTHVAFKRVFGPTEALKFSFNAAFEVGPEQRRPSAIQRFLNFFKRLFR
jgi:hypothetical protein